MANILPKKSEKNEFYSSIDRFLKEFKIGTLFCTLKTPGYAGGSGELSAWGQKKPHFMIR